MAGPRIRTKRVYEAPARGDGRRVLIDRLWPRGVSKEAAAVDYWAKSIAPSNELRKWYGHEVEKWERFRERYFAEIDANPEGLAALRDAIRGARVVTIVFSSREEEWNNATALKQYLEQTRS